MTLCIAFFKKYIYLTTIIETNVLRNLLLSTAERLRDTMQKFSTIGELKKSGYEVLPVKDEIRRNLIEKMMRKETLFPGIIGFEQTVIPSIIDAILAKHDIMFLGLRGQAKSRIVRLLPLLLDEFVPIVKGCEINDNPYKPVCKRCVDLVNEHGDEIGRAHV